MEEVPENLKVLCESRTGARAHIRARRPLLALVAQLGLLSLEPGALPGLATVKLLLETVQLLLHGLLGNAREDGCGPIDRPTPIFPRIPKEAVQEELDRFQEQLDRRKARERARFEAEQAKLGDQGK